MGTHLFLTIFAPKDGQLTWPRRRTISAVGSSAWTAQIRRSAAFLQKKTLILKRNQPALLLPLSVYFSKKPSTFTKINPQSVPSYGLIFCLVGPACLEWAKNGP